MIAGVNIVYLPGTRVEPGGYMHCYIAPNGPWCGSLAPSIPAVVDGQNEAAPESDQPFFRVYPNPTDGKFIVEYMSKTPVDKMTVEIYGMKGERILYQELLAEPLHEFSLEGRPTGIYLVRMLTDELTKTVRIIKQ